MEHNNEKSLLSKALLGGQDMKQIKQFELGYFHKVFGHAYADLREIDLIPLIKTQGKLLNYLNMILKFRKNHLRSVFRVLNAFEKKVTSYLLPQGSFCKFFFQV